MHFRLASRTTSIVTVVLLLLGLLIPLTFVTATSDTTTTPAATGTVGSEKSTGPQAKRRTTVRQLTNPLGSTSIEGIVGRAVTIFTGLSGSVALLMFMYGGVMWLTSGGNAERVERGKKIFTWATIGLVIIFGAYAILSAIFGAIGAT